MALWDELPSALRDSGELDGLRPLLDGLTGTGPVETTEPDGTWSTYTATQDLTGPLALDPRTGGFSSSRCSSIQREKFSGCRLTTTKPDRSDRPRPCGVTAPRRSCW